MNIGALWRQPSAISQTTSGHLLKYFLTVFLVHTRADTLTEAKYRELRTYVEAVDGLLRGNTLQVCDLLVQQFKATTMALKDNDWSAARWLQLIPHEVSRHSTVSTALNIRIVRKLTIFLV